MNWLSAYPYHYHHYIQRITGQSRAKVGLTFSLTKLPEPDKVQYIHAAPCILNSI